MVRDLIIMGLSILGVLMILLGVAYQAVIENTNEYGYYEVVNG